MKKMYFLFFAAAVLLTAADALAQASYVRKRLEPKFFMPEDAKVQPEKLPMPRYTKGAETTIKEANYRDSETEEEQAEIYDSAVEDEAETDDSMPLYQQKYDDYSRGVHREYDWVLTEVEAGDTTNVLYGLAVDYGSTTIIMQLIDLKSGNVISEEREENGQIKYGTDILTRIIYSMETEEHRKNLQKVTVATFHNIMKRLTEKSGIDVLKLPLMILSGNTTMIHFLMELDAWTVFAAPYSPVTTVPGFLWGNELGLEFQGLIYTIPAASNYVGGDIISGLLRLDIHKQEQTQMFFDIGTNGELVIGNQDWMIAGAGAAGPALEGYISRYGMRASAGAIDHIKISNNELSYTTIADTKPVGICGSGIIDLLAQMRLHGWINIAGKLEPTVSKRIVYHPEEEQYVVIYAYAEESGLEKDLYFSQLDIDQYLDTK